jgi:16S rRNA G966 N2-methylase RsmD
MKDINYALIEETRPPIYTAMKYWGKKPHNIWRAYIENYTPQDGIFLDPFAGSAMSAFEAVKAGRKAVAFDLNPLTSFTIEALCSDFKKDIFEIELNKIISKVEQDEIYKEYLFTTCRQCNNKNALVQNYKWENGKIYEMGVICEQCGKKGKYLTTPNSSDIKKAEESKNLKIPFWYPKDIFHKSPSFTASFIKNIGGNNFSDIWTRRNLYIISEIFDSILENKNEEVKKQLLCGFIKTIHLCTKMSVPRRENADRAFSTSWGRSAYICSARQMEMNPLLVFYGSCLGKQSVESALNSVKSYIGKVPKILYIDKSNKSNKSKSFDIKYGIVDINTITDYLEKDSIDFIMTDPPYGGLVQYLDLSAIWLIWLQKYNIKYKPNFENEITIKKGIQDIKAYQIKFQNGIKNLFKVLKPDGKIVFTFHNKDIMIWNAFLNAITMSGFKIEKVIHQQNRRTGESNVANPYGTSATDFYIRCIKAPSANLKTDKGEFEHFILQKAIYLIAQRNEPTPYQILFNGLLAEISMAGFDIENFDENVESMLSKHIGTIFTLSNNKGRAGNYWWFVKPEDYIKNPDKLLTGRVEETIISLLRRKVAVTLDEVLAEIFVKYPNGLTPDIKSVDVILEKYANKSGGRWVYKGEEIEKDFTRHSEIIYKLSIIGKKLGYKIYIGKREQPELYNAKRLSTFADIDSLDFIEDKTKRARIEMIDVLWIDNNQNIQFALEVENSTNFTSGVQRASNLEISTSKLMIVPDERKKEFKALADPLFTDNFKHYNWRYLYYSAVERLASSQKIDIKDIDKYTEKE